MKETQPACSRLSTDLPSVSWKTLSCSLPAKVFYCASTKPWCSYPAKEIGSNSQSSQENELSNAPLFLKALRKSTTISFTAKTGKLQLYLHMPKKLTAAFAAVLFLCLCLAAHIQKIFQYLRRQTPDDPFLPNVKINVIFTSTPPFFGILRE